MLASFRVREGNASQDENRIGKRRLSPFPFFLRFLFFFFSFFFSLFFSFFFRAPPALSASRVGVRIYPNGAINSRSMASLLFAPSPLQRRPGSFSYFFFLPPSLPLPATEKFGQPYSCPRFFDASEDLLRR